MVPLLSLISVLSFALKLLFAHFTNEENIALFSNKGEAGLRSTVHYQDLFT